MEKEKKNPSERNFTIAKKKTTQKKKKQKEEEEKKKSGACAYTQLCVTSGSSHERTSSTERAHIQTCSLSADTLSAERTALFFFFFPPYPSNPRRRGVKKKKKVLNFYYL